MKTKKILLLTMSILAITTLSACRGGRGRGRGSTSGSDSAQTTNAGPSGFIPGGSSQGGNSGNSQGGSSTNPSSVTKESLAADINTIFAAAAEEGEDFLEYNSTYDSYSGAADYSQEGVDYSNTKAEQSVLKPVVDDMRTYLPSYLTFVSEKYYTSAEDFWNDDSGDTVYEAVFTVNGTELDVIGYCYNGYLLGQIEIYTPAS